MRPQLFISTEGQDPEFITLRPRKAVDGWPTWSMWLVSSFCPFTLISVLMPLALFVINLVFSALISMSSAVEALSRHSTNFVSSSCSPAKPLMSSAIQRLVTVLPQMLTVPSWSSMASVMILSKNMVKRVGESRHPCQTPTVIWNQSPMLLLERTALVALMKMCLMTWIKLALMLYFFMVAHNAECKTLSKAFLKSMKTQSCWCWWCFSQRILRLKICSVVLLPALKPACSSAMIFFARGFNLSSMIFSMTLLGWLIMPWFWHCSRLPFLGIVMSKDWDHGVGHSPVCQILLQIVERAMITASPAWTSSAGML